MAAANVTVIDKIYAHAGQLVGVVLDYIGPASYVQVAGAGDTVKPSDIGLKNIHKVIGGSDGDGVNVIYPLDAQSNKAVGQTTSIKLMWVVIGTGAEVAGEVNLSARRTHLMVWGN